MEKMYFEAARKLLGNPYDAEVWLDSNSSKLSMSITSLDEAISEIKTFI